MNVHFFRGIQKSFPRARTTKTTKTNKPFLRPRQRSLAVKNSKKEPRFKDKRQNYQKRIEK